MKTRLEELSKSTRRKEQPLIYHFDVGAMYPNIILTNRLQPSSVVTEEDCAACDFNKPESDCQREMDWCWRGDIIVPTRSEVDRIRQQLEGELVKNPYNPSENIPFHKLRQNEQDKMVKERSKLYSKSVYKRTKDTTEEIRKTTVCQRENPFYVDTVLAFRDRRYEFKGKLKKAKIELNELTDAAEQKACKAKIVYFDSQQLAHKCILNSFYGYMMRRGSRWFSMEVAGIICYTGATIIKHAREIVEKIGQPLELDTDGIWCMLPKLFPDEYVLKTTKGKKLFFNFMNSYLNIMVKEDFVNPQYQTLVNEDTLEYDKEDKCTIFFEADGPYLAMFLPSSREEGKKLKKRYAVYEHNKKLSEIKGFELKRNGELELIKKFQKNVFEDSLWCEGTNLKECYKIIADEANKWLNILLSKGQSITEEELVTLVAEKRTMSKSLAEYGTQKSTSITTARRLSEFLGDQMVKDKGLCCNFFISQHPRDAPVTERAIPLAIYQAPKTIKERFIKKWSKDYQLSEFGIKDLLDWDYYIERFSNAVQKIVTIPAWEQSLENPCPNVKNPDWVYRTDKNIREDSKQRRMKDFFKVTTREERLANTVIEAPRKRKKEPDSVEKEKSQKSKPDFSVDDLCKHWREVLNTDDESSRIYHPNKESWIKFQKKKWRFMILQRRMHRRKGAMPPPAKHQKTVSSGLGAMDRFMQQKARKLHQSEWDVIQISPTKSCGVFNMFICADGEVHLIKLQVPRRFYISRVEQLDENFVKNSGFLKKVKRELPRSAPGKFLYECVLPEDEFQVSLMNLKVQVIKKVCIYFICILNLHIQIISVIEIESSRLST